MGNTLSINRLNFKDMQYAIANNMIIISTLEINNQECLIKNTLAPDEEINVINDLIQKKNKKKKNIIYGENSSDNSIVKKYYQLQKLGINNIFIYMGGLFGGYYYKIFTAMTNFLQQQKLLTF